MGGLTGQIYRPPPSMRIADEIYLMAYDMDRDWYRVGDHVLRLGLAGALLAELLLDRVATVRGERIVIEWPARQPPPLDALVHTVLERIRNNDDVTSVQDWLRILSDKSYEDVVDRLHRFRHVAAAETRRMLKTSLVYRPVNPEGAMWPESRISVAVGHRSVMPARDWVLAGLVVAVGLSSHVFFHPSADSEHVRDMTSQLPEPMRELIAEIEKAVAGTASRPN